MKQYTFKDGTKVIASSVEEAKAKHKVMASKENNFYKLKKPLKDLLKENADLEISFSKSSHGEVCPNCNALTANPSLRFCGKYNAYAHNKCFKCGCEWDANFKLTPIVISDISLDSKS